MLNEAVTLDSDLYELKVLMLFAADNWGHSFSITFKLVQFACFSILVCKGIDIRGTHL